MWSATGRQRYDRRGRSPAAAGPERTFVDGGYEVGWTTCDVTAKTKARPGNCCALPCPTFCRGACEWQNGTVASSKSLRTEKRRESL